MRTLRAWLLWKLSHKTNCISVDDFDEDLENFHISMIMLYTRSNELPESVLGWAIHRVHS